MKFLVLSFALVAAVSAQQGYKPVPAGAPYARILDQRSEISPDGSYDWKYDTENGISAFENGAPRAVGPNGEPANDVVGGYQYTAPDGQVIAVKYSSGPQGFVAEGNHLPVGPPIPEAILRSLAYNAAHPQKDDAYYKGEQAEKPYYTQPIAPTPRPFVQYPTPTPFYPSVQPTYQSPFQAGIAQQRGSFPPQPFQAGRR